MDVRLLRPDLFGHVEKSGPGALTPGIAGGPGEPLSNLTRGARLYIVSVYCAGLAALILSWAFGDRPASFHMLLIALAVAGAAAPFRVHVPVFGNVSIAFTFIFAILILLGTSAAALSAAVAAVSASVIRRRGRSPLYRIAFNAANLILATVATGLVFRLLGGEVGSFEPATEWLPALISTVVFFLVNTWFVAVVVSLTDGVPLVRNWSTNFLWTCPVYVAGSALAAILVLGVQHVGLWALLLSLPPLYVLFFSLRLYASRATQERRHHREMADLYLSIIEALALAIDAKDRTTQRHIRRVQTYAVELGRVLGLSHAELEALKAGSLLHDIGKLAVPEHILCKPGRLSREEFEKMKIHPRIGAEILETVQFPFPLVSIVRSHHEKWDGTGYPDRLKGEEIPMGARILSVVDCFDALTSDRPYRRPLTKKEALVYLQSEAGSFYDPRVVGALVDNLNRMEELAGRVNRSRETWTAPDKRQVNQGDDRLSRDTNELRRSIMKNISSAHRELYALYEIAQNLAKSLNLEEALSFIASKVARLVHYRCLILYLYDEEQKVLKARYVTGHDAARLKDHQVKMGERMSGWAAVHRMPLAGRAHLDPVKREGERSDLEEILKSKTIEPLENAIVAPLLDGDSILGVLALYDRPDQPYEEDSLRVISIVAKHVGSAVKNTILYESTQESALTDPLTSLPNARYLFVSFEEEISRAMRQQVPLSIIELDVNDFKEVNDRHGHPAGDRILREMARVIRDQLRGCDTCVRYAGDEFIVTVPGVDKEGIDRVQSRIQKAIEEHRFPLHGGRHLRISVSMGAATFPEDGRVFDALLAVADARMHDHKFMRRRPADPDGLQKFSGRRDVPVN
jgi:diguanylate cyclase (GGDEF)-like protein/putative nucleotidyltransferase with HDIG domain